MNASISFSWVSTSKCLAMSAGAMVLVTFRTACLTPLPPYAVDEISRSSRASWIPVEAPEGTRPVNVPFRNQPKFNLVRMWGVPLSVVRRTCTVGLPRESRR